MNIGEIRYGTEIGRHSEYIKYIYTACEDCGKERWVRLLKGEPRNKICLHCTKLNFARMPKPWLVGERSSRWKGGHIIKNGYILVKLQPNDFFYSMVAKSGYVPEHRLVMAKSLGRNLHRWEIIHHKNHIKDDNRIENLQLVSDDRHKQITILETKINRLEAKIDKLLLGQKDLKQQIKLLQWQLREQVKMNSTY